MNAPADVPSLSVADLDVELVSALYRAAGEADNFDALVDTLQRRFSTQAPATEEGLPQRIEQQLGSIETLMEGKEELLSGDPLERAVGEVPTAAVVVDPFGVTLLSNELGEQAFGTRPGQKFDLQLIAPRDRTHFSDFLKSARMRGNLRRIIVRLDGEQLLVRFQATGESKHFPLDLAEAIIVETPSRDHGFVALRALDIPWTKTIESQLSATFDLTMAEVEIARDFYHLRETRLVADRRGTSLATVQTQLKTIYSKTQTKNQVSLLHLLSLLAARANLDRKSRLLAWSNPIGREATFVRSDGREIAYSWQGAEDGKPVIVIHGQALGHIFPPEADRIFREAGLKLFIISRPGYGHSEWDPKRAAVDDHAFAISEMMAALDIRGAPALTCSSGLVPLVRALRDDPALVSSIFHLGFLWSNDLDAQITLPTEQRVVFNLARYTPSLLLTFVRIAYRNINRCGVDWYIERLVKKIPPDHEYFRRGSNAGLVRSSAGHLLIQGPEIFTRELQQVVDPWLQELRKHNLPVHMVLPEHDAIHRFEAFREGLKLPATTTFDMLPECGELAFYQAAEEIALKASTFFAKA